MAVEWYNQLQQFGSRTVHRAIDKLLVESKFFPTLAEVYQSCDADERGWKDAIGCGDTVTKPEPSKPFERDGRTHVEELAYRAAELRRIKLETGFKPEADEPRSGPETWKPASRSAGVSYRLFHSCGARRARGEETCSDSCQRGEIGSEGCRIDVQKRVQAGIDDTDVGSSPDDETPASGL